MPSPLLKSDIELLAQCDGMTSLPESDEIKGLIARSLVRLCNEGETNAAWQDLRICDNPCFPQVNWMITGRCNYRCKHCFIFSDEADYHTELSLEACLRLLDEFEECGIQGINLTGGEPLIREDIEVIFAGIAARGMELCEIVTNGAFVTQGMLDKLRALALDPLFKISLDGLGCHDDLRQSQDAQELAIKAISLVKKNGFKVNVQMALHEGNRDVALDTARYLNSMGVDSMRIMRIMEVPRWLDIAPEPSLSFVDYYDFCLDFLVQYAQEQALMSMELWQFATYEPKNDRVYIRPVACSPEAYKPSIPLCCTARMAVSIRYDGELVFCYPLSGFLRREGTGMGNVTEEKLSTLLKRSEFSEMVGMTVGELFEKSPSCSACEYWTQCLGGCRATAYGLSKSDWYAPDPMKCIFFKNKYPQRIKDALGAYVGRFR